MNEFQQAIGITGRQTRRTTTWSLLHRQHSHSMAKGLDIWLYLFVASCLLNKFIVDPLQPGHHVCFQFNELAWPGQNCFTFYTPLGANSFDTFTSK